MRAVELTGALADPQQVGRAVVPVVGEAVAPGERLLVAEDQRLVRRVEVDLVELVLGVEVDAAGGHEAQRAVDLAGERLVAAALGAGVDELEVPRVHARQVGEAALREGAAAGSAWTRTGGTRARGASGSGRRAAASNAKSFTMSPRNDGSSMPSRVSVGAERGLANWPAMRPIFTVGTPLP